MARPLKNGEPKVHLRQTNGKYYATTSTSRMVNGKKVTETTYLGIYDPDTKTIKQKKARGKHRPKAETEEVRKDLTVVDYMKGLSCYEYGSVYLLDIVQHKCNLGRDLFICFGEHIGRSILGIAMALALENGGAFSHVEDTMDRCMLRQIYGLAPRYTSSEISELTKNIGICNSNIDDFFSYRVRECTGVISWDSTTKGIYSSDSVLADYLKDNKDNEDIPQIKKSIASDKNGVPVMFELHSGSMSDMATLQDFVARIRRYGPTDIVYVMDRGYCSGANLHFMNTQGIEFVIPATTSSKAVKTLFSKFHTVHKEHKVFDDHAYDVWEAELAIVRSKRMNADGSQAYDFVLPEDASDTDEHISAFVCYDTAKNSDEIQTLRLLIENLSKRFEKIDSPDPMKEFKAIAGKAAKYFSAQANGRKLDFKVKNNAVTFAENRAGTFMILTSKGMTWSNMMSYYDIRRLVEQNFDYDKDAWKRFNTSDPLTMRGREFIRFVALILRCELKYMLRSAGVDLDPYGALNSSAAICAMGTGKVWTVKNVCKKHRDLFECLDLPLPTEVTLGLPIATQEELDRLVSAQG